MNRDDFVYTACFCEENVRLLLERIRLMHTNDDRPDTNSSAKKFSAFAVFVSNAAKRVPIWCQTRGSPVVWDYHVFAVVQKDESSIANNDSTEFSSAAIAQKSFVEVLDLDTTLPFPCTFSEYMKNSCPILSRNSRFVEFDRRYRVISAGEFIATFASDRRHMRLDNGDWSSPPPDYPAFLTQNSEFNLDEYWNMTTDFGINRPGFGIVLDEEGFRRMFAFNDEFY